MLGVQVLNPLLAPKCISYSRNRVFSRETNKNSKMAGFRNHLHTVFQSKPLLFPISRGVLSQTLGLQRSLSCYREDPEMNDFMEYMESLKNFEKSGVPKGAGTDSDEGFDLGRMRRLMDRLGNPQSNYKAIHVAGTKGKGSSAAYLSNILRAEGYSVGCYSSPHLLSIRERMSLGSLGEPVSAKALNNLFHKVKQILEEAIECENGCLSHFEVVTAMAFTLFSEANVDIAVIEAGLGGARDATNIINGSELAASVITTIGEEHLAALGGSLESIAEAKSGIIKHGRPLILGGPFLPHIEKILLDKASLMSSPVISASDVGINTAINGISMFNGRPCQSCDIHIHAEKDVKLRAELLDLKLCMLGSHQLQNAATAACAALCLREQGWRMKYESIRAGLQNTCLLGRSQFLTSEEAETLGLPGATILLDGAHTKESAKALMDTIQMIFPDKRLALVVTMANDKDHLSFAKQFLSGKHLEAVFLTEADIAGGKARTTSPSLLRDSWIEAAKQLGIEGILHDGMTEYQELFKNPSILSSTKAKDKTILAVEKTFSNAMSLAHKILTPRANDETGIIVVTGSLHVVSLILASLMP